MPPAGVPTRQKKSENHPRISFSGRLLFIEGCDGGNGSGHAVSLSFDAVEENCGLAVH